MNENIIFMFIGIGQIVFYFIAVVYKLFGLKSKLLYIPYYYSLTIYAQLVGAFRQIQECLSRFGKRQKVLDDIKWYSHLRKIAKTQEIRRLQI